MIGNLKQHTTKLFRFIAGCYVFFPLLFLTAGAVLFNLPASSFIKIFLSPIFWITSVFSMISGFGLWEMRRWSWYLFTFSKITVLYLIAWTLGNYSETNYKFLAFLFSVCLELFFFIKITQEIRVPYFFPHIRWWESNPRYRFQLPVKVIINSKEITTTALLDVSSYGGFLKSSDPWEIGQNINLVFDLFGISFDVPGTVVWRTESGVTCPKGVGVKFLVQDKKLKRNLKLITLQIKRLNYLYRTGRFLMNPDEFSNKYSALFKTNLLLKETLPIEQKQS